MAKNSHFEGSARLFRALPSSHDDLSERETAAFASPNHSKKGESSVSINPSERLLNLPPQFFADLVGRAEKLRQAGHPVINLGQGNPDQSTPTAIVDALKNAADNPLYHRYIPFNGLFELKRAVADWYLVRYGVVIDPDREVSILIGSKIGLQEISLALLNPGDTAMVPDPGYPDYWSGIRLAGAEMMSLPLRPDLDFLPDLGAWVPSAKLAFLNYPNNPTGRLASPQFLDEVIRLASKDHVVLAHDLAYGDITFDGRQSVSLLSRPGGKDVGVEFTTVSKSYNMAGWRLGFAVGNPTLIRYLDLLQDHLHCSQFGAIQMAGIAALGQPPEALAQLRTLYQHRRDLLIASAAEAGWEIPPSEGSVFVWCPIPTSESAVKFCDRVLRDADVVLAPGTGFGEAGEGYVRISLTASSDQLVEAMRRIGQLMSSSTRG